LALVVPDRAAPSVSCFGNDLPIQGKPFPAQGNDFPGHKTALAGPEKRCNCLVNEDLREEAGCLARFARFNAHLIIYGRRSRKPDKLF
jgi:hypothetical protein